MVISTFPIIDSWSLIIISLRNTVLLHSRVRGRDCGKKASGIRMHWILENLLRSTCLKQMSQMKNSDTVWNIFYHRKVMSNKQIRSTCLLLNILHQVYHLRLNRIIRNNQLRVHDQRTGNADTLSLSAGKLMRVSCRMLRSKTNLCQNGFDLLLSLLFALVHMMDIKTLTQNIPNFFSGIQRCHRVLENHLHLCS